MTINTRTPSIGDPRTALSSEERRRFATRGVPTVAQGAGAHEPMMTMLGLACAGALGMLVFFSMSKDKVAAETLSSSPPIASAQAAHADGAPIDEAVAAGQATKTQSQPASALAAAANPASVLVDPRAAALVLDFSAAPTGAVSAATGPSPPRGAPTSQEGLLGEEAFAQRIGAEEPAMARSVKMANPQATIPQGALIPAILETAINSDLPGFARAMVSRDVHSMDGTRVLIPRGARLIGQYKSGLASGQTRAYIIWARVLLPDGTSVQLGSPLIDEVGETGANGRVDKHFFDRFGAASALSILGGAIGAFGKTDSVVISTSAQAQSVASIALQNDGRIPPTIRVPQGEPIQVFVSRDLLFDD